MKNAMIYFYNLNPEDLIKVNNTTYSFYIGYEKYYLSRINRPEEDIKEIISIVEQFPNSFHQIIKNRINEPITEIDEIPYILLKIRCAENNEIDINDILNNIPYENKKSVLLRTNWSTLWSNKIDYLEYQVSELASHKEIIRKSFSYYCGLAENAVQYFNMLGDVNLPTFIAHKRIRSNTRTLDFYNPLNIIIDYRMRDISSFLKAAFFETGTDASLKLVDIIINKGNLSSLEYNILFARLLYPSYYFDELNNVLEKNKDEDSLLKYIDKINEYEIFLNKVFKKFTEHSSMITIDWLIS